MGRPLVGISAALERARFTVWEDIEVNVSPRAYSREVEAAGGVAVLLPAQDPGKAEELLEPLSGLILAGGADLDPATYGAAVAPGTTGFNSVRDRFELALVRAALDMELPVLGICRGMQLLNVACGGTLDQQIENQELHLHRPGTFADHSVRVEAGSLAARAVGGERIAVRSHHHQGVGRLGEELVATGWSEPDGLVEAIELPGRAFALGVLWHTEEEPDGTVVAALLEAAREREAVA